MKSILIITTGGTISMEKDPKTGGDIPSLNGQALVLSIPKAHLPVSVEVYEYANKPSPHLTVEDMMALAKYIYSNKDKYTGFVITHGTDVLEETAFFLDIVLPDDIKVAITASMRANDDIGVDGPRNLVSAIKTVLEGSTNGFGVVVVVNDEIHDPYTVTKTYTSNVSTFQSPGFGLLGIVDDDKVFMARKKYRRLSIPLLQYDKDVFLYKTFFGDDGSILDQIIKGCRLHGLVVEGFGRGNVPPKLASIIKSIVKSGIPVVISTRCHLGRTLGIYAYDGGGMDLEKNGCIVSKDLKPHKALILLKILLGNGLSSVDIKKVFDNF